MKRLTLIALLLMSATTLMAQKTPLSQADYDGWRRLSKAGLSDNGDYFYYVEKPQKGDAKLIVKSRDLKRSLTVDRAEELSFVGNRFAMFKILPKMADVRALKLKKTPKDKLPKDTACLMDLEKMSYTKLEKDITYKQIGELSVLQFVRTIKLPADTTKKDSDKKDDKAKKPKSYKRLVFWNLETGDSLTVDSIKNAFTSKTMTFAYTKEIDSVEYLFVKQGDKEYKIFGEKNSQVKSLAFDEDANQLAFIYTLDTAKNKVYDLAYFDLRAPKKSKYMAAKLELNYTESMPEGFCVEESAPSFTLDGKLLKFKITTKPEEEAKDTLTDEEKFSLDLWSYTDTVNMPKQLVQKQGNESYTAIWNPKSKEWLQLGNEYIKEVKIPDNTEPMLATCVTSNPYMIKSDWDYPVGSDHYLVDLKSGKRTLLMSDFIGWMNYSPTMTYAVAWNARENQLISVNLKTREVVNLSDTIDFSAHNDTPTYRNAQGSLGWSKDGAFFYAYDKYDLWRLDVTGKSAPVCVTRGFGRETNQRLRAYFPFERKGMERNYINEADVTMFQAFNYANKQSAFYRIEKDTEPVKLIGGEYHYSIILIGKKKDLDLCLWTRENFNEYPDLWIGTKQFENATKVSNLSSQMDNRLWGSVELIEWTDFNGKKSTGMLYKPENYDPTRKYPTIVYFYEKMSDQLYRYNMPQPSASIIIPPYCTSNGYVVFIPDIDYKAGYPGECCYNKVVSGSQALIERGIADPERMGLQGQSWGGYQIAYLVTRTNMFRCASPGAPVTNMTSAYTGIRTGSGMVRMFMYEHGQSRIGASLWEAPMRYIENSPVFYAPKVETPLLIRHDDADEAVPFQQGVEFFMALKRHGKTVWMLNYNKEPHNLKSRAARMDWDKRMMQFFDYYLKDAKMPRWMKEGISAKEKNKDRKYELVD